MANTPRVFGAVLLLLFGKIHAQTAHHFTSPDEVLAFAKANSTVGKSGGELAKLAKQQAHFAKINRFNPKAPVNYSGTDNTQLPANFIPAEIFGGPAGAFREVQFGQQFVQSVNFQPQFDLVNPSAWAKWRSVKSAEQLSAANSDLNERNLLEMVLATYFNAVAAQEQLIVTARTMANADSILQIVRQKNGQGLVRIQDVNNAEANKLLVADRLQLLEKTRQQQLENLRLLCDMDVADSIFIEHLAVSTVPTAATANGSLLVKQSERQREMARLELKTSRAANFPTFSIVGNWAWQENSNRTFFDKNARWIPASYFGWRLSVPIPDASRLSQTATAAANLRLAELNLEHQMRQQAAQNRQLELDFQKAAESHRIAVEIKRLKTDSHQKNLNLFRQDIYAADNLFVSFNDALNAALNERAAAVNLQFQQARISLNNSKN